MGGSPGPREMTFLDHLDELRGVVMRSMIVVVVLMVLAFFFAARLQDLLTWPFAHAAGRVGPTAGHLALLSPTEGFLVHLKIAFFAGLLASSPYLFLQVWGFVSPGLHAREKRLVLPVVSVASLLFLAGALFGYFILGVATEFLLHFSTGHISNSWSLSSYITFTAQIMFGLGLVFQLPLVLMFLTYLGLVTPRQLAGWRRQAAVGILVVVAMLPMQDPFSLLLMSGPLYLLYEFSILAGRFVERRRRKREQDSGPGPEAPGAPPASPGHPGGEPGSAPAPDRPAGPGPDSGPGPEPDRMAQPGGPFVAHHDGDPDTVMEEPAAATTEPVDPAPEAPADSGAETPVPRVTRRRARRERDLFEDIGENYPD